MNKERIIAKIRGLSAITTANGASEEEAANCLAKAQELMDRYNISLTETSPIPSFVTLTLSTNCIRRKPIFNVLMQLAKFCEVEAFMSTGQGGYKNINFFGTPTNNAMAEYLFTVIDACLDYSLSEYHLTPEYLENSFSSKKLKTSSFEMGFISRIVQKMKDIKASSHTPAATTAIVFVHSTARTAALATAYPTLTTARAPSRKYTPSAFNAGHTAGNSVNLNRPMANGTTQGRIS